MLNNNNLMLLHFINTLHMNNIINYQIHNQNFLCFKLGVLVCEFMSVIGARGNNDRCSLQYNHCPYKYDHCSIQYDHCSIRFPAATNTKGGLLINQMTWFIPLSTPFCVLRPPVSSECIYHSANHR